MQIDMHFNATYCLARAAGIAPETANIIATCAQFVDDAVAVEPALLDTEAFHVPCASCHSVLDTANLDHVDQWHVWVPYHFLPGNKGGSAQERLICRRGDKGNPATDAMLTFAQGKLAEPSGAHLLGVVTHVLQDSYSHAGFMGISSQYNNVINGSIDIGSMKNDELREEKSALVGKVTDFLEAPGHASVFSLPDFPYLVWSFEYKHGNDVCPRHPSATLVQRNNPDEFLDACRRLYTVFAEMAAKAPSRWRTGGGKDFTQFEKTIEDILSLEAHRNRRGQAWMKALRQEIFCKPHDEDNFVNYSANTDWTNFAKLDGTPEPPEDYVLFMQASHRYRAFVHGELLPSLSPNN